MSSGLCVHPEGGVAIDGVKLILWAGCDEQRLAFHFLVHGETQFVTVEGYKYNIMHLTTDH